MASDAQAGKNNLVVVLGKQRARWGYLLILGAAFLSVLMGVAAGVLPLFTLLTLGGIPLAIAAARILFRHTSDRGLIKANAMTILLQLLAGGLLIAGLLLSTRAG